ncbi:MAG: type VI secretion system lipoprotein TssJ [Tabrizicola sp.]|nr:type VI secretion system lipoprotein TssJ [Tabrizicola sp.]
MIERRTVVLGLGGVGGLALAGCVAPKAGSVTIQATGAAGMNPGPDGSDRPLTLTIVQLRSAGAFDGADFFALQNPSAALGAELVKADQIALTAGSPATKTIALEATTSLIGVIAGFRDPAGKTFRAKAAVKPTGKSVFAVSVSPSGLTLTPA